MPPVEAAFAESLAHTILTVELTVGVIVGCVFIGLYARRPWWSVQAGRLAMGNMVALTLIAAAGLLYRLGLQASALTLLIPTCALVLAVQMWWVWQLLTAKRD